MFCQKSLEGNGRSALLFGFQLIPSTTGFFQGLYVYVAGLNVAGLNVAGLMFRGHAFHNMLLLVSSPHSRDISWSRKTIPAGEDLIISRGFLGI